PVRHAATVTGGLLPGQLRDMHNDPRPAPPPAGQPGSRGARRSSARPGDDKGVSGQRVAREDPAGGFLDLYDRALPQVYGYLLARCGQRAVAEDLTAETFLAAVDAVRGVRGGAAAPLSAAWLIGVARHKLCDHWRRQAREERTLRAVAAEPEPGPADPWGGTPDAVAAPEGLRPLRPPHPA